MKKKVLIFTGAGVSAESGVATFRTGDDGLWYNHKVEDVATPSGWRRDREKVLNFYNMRRAQMKDVEPNLAHKIIAELESDYDVTVVTQNVDDLHERAGSTNIIHLHGELTKARGCMYDHKTSPLDTVIDVGYNEINIGDKCPTSGSQLRPHIVWFGEDLDSDNIKMATEAALDCDFCVIVGTSMQVFPANQIPFLTKSNTLIYIVDPSDMDFYIDKQRKPFITHIKEVASVGMQKVRKELKDILLNDVTNN
jgi:NAD-dependent deacetylase